MKNLSVSNKEIRIHIICWIVYMIYEIVVAGLIGGDFGYFFEHALAYFIHISFFYIHSLFVLPRAIRDKAHAYWKVPVFVISELLVYIIIYAVLLLTGAYLIDREGLNITDFPNLSVQYVSGVFYRCIFFMFLSTGYYFLRTTINNTKQQAAKEVQIERLTNKLLKVELNYLRAQVNPHLLFNTLNFIKYSAKHSPDDAGKAVMLLSSILDFATQGKNKEKVRLNDEIEQVDNLIALNQLRFDNRLNIQFEQAIHDDTISILPLALLTLVENVFKHGNLLDKDTPATIYVETSDDKVLYRTKNTINNRPSSPSNHTGLENLRHRLQRKFPGRSSLEYGVNREWFEVECCVHQTELV